MSPTSFNSRSRRPAFPRGKRSTQWRRLVVALSVAVFFPGAPVFAQEEGGVIDLTLERMVDLALSSSYRVRQLNMSIDRTMHRLRAEQARLKSSVEMDVTLPMYRSTSEPRWNSELQKYQIAHENTRLWQGELSIRQPLILFGYPTNGYLSINNELLRYEQVDDDGSRDVDYVNEYFIRYVQPFFQPNRLKNDLEEAELDLEDARLDFFDDVVGIVDDLSDDYLELFEVAYGRRINENLENELDRALIMARDLAATDSARAIEVGQIQVELANAGEQVQQAASDFRLRSAYIKQRLGLTEADSITLDPVLFLDPVQIDVDEAVQYAMGLTPSLRQMDISYREGEIRLDETKGRNSFRMDVSLSYGREMLASEVFNRLWTDPRRERSYTVAVDAYLPIWDWGERKARIASSQIGLDQTLLRREEVENQIVSNVRNEVRNVEEYQSRTLAMQENLELARAVSESSFTRYEQGAITALDLIQSLRREADTAQNFLDTYLGWRRGLLRLQELTFFDFEEGMPVLERFGVEATPPDWN